MRTLPAENCMASSIKYVTACTASSTRMPRTSISCLKLSCRSRAASLVELLTNDAPRLSPVGILAVVCLRRLSSTVVLSMPNATTAFFPSMASTLPGVPSPSRRTVSPTDMGVESTGWTGCLRFLLRGALASNGCSLASRSMAFFSSSRRLRASAVRSLSA